MPPNKNKQSIEDKRKAKRERERKRRQKIKEDPVKYEEARKKEKERRLRRKNEKKILVVGDLTPRQQRIQRKEWRERAKKSRLNKKLAERALRAVRDETPVTDDDINPRSPSPSLLRRDNPVLRRLCEDTPMSGTPNVLSSGDDSTGSSSVSRQKIDGNKRARRHRMLARITIQKQEKIILDQKRKIAALQKKLKRLTMIKQKEIPVAARKKQRIIYEEWAKRKQAIAKFLEDDENSMISPGIKDTITRRKIKKQKRYLCDSLEKLHAKYNAQSPLSSRVSYASFCRLRPFWVLKAKLTDRDTCMCILHENFKMIVDRLKSLKILETNDVTSSAVCDINSYKCMSRKCSQCVNKLPFLTPFEDEEISYHQWISQNEERNIRGQIKTIRRTVKARLLSTKKALVEKFFEVLPTFLLHKFNISNQHKTLTHIREHLREREVLVRVDFSENFACKYYAEAQSVHFGASRQQVSLHTGVFYYLSPLTGEPDTISFCSVSDCLRHDASAVFAHLKKALLHLMKDQEINILHIASDGPSSQYKNKNNFYLFTQHLVNILNVSEATWHFSESAHGKSPADGVGAAVKETANNYVLKGNDVPDYDTFVKVIKENCNVLLYEVTENDINVGDDLLMSAGQINQLVGTKKMHQITWNRADPKMINMRELTCIDCGITNYCVHYSISRQEIVRTRTNQDRFDANSGSRDQEIIPGGPAGSNDQQIIYAGTAGSSNQEIISATPAGSNDQEIIIPPAPDDSRNSENLTEGVWVLAKFEGPKKQTVLYVGQIISVHNHENEPFLIKFTRKKYHSVMTGTTVFIWKEPDDLTSLGEESIARTLPEPTPSRRGELIFNFDFSDLDYRVM